MNETLELMMKRKSVRVFEEKPIGARRKKQAIFKRRDAGPYSGELYALLHFRCDGPSLKGQAL